MAVNRFPRKPRRAPLKASLLSPKVLELDSRREKFELAAIQCRRNAERYRAMAENLRAPIAPPAQAVATHTSLENKRTLLTTHTVDEAVEQGLGALDDLSKILRKELDALAALRRLVIGKSVDITFRDAAVRKKMQTAIARTNVHGMLGKAEGIRSDMKAYFARACDKLDRNEIMEASDVG